MISNRWTIAEAPPEEFLQQFNHLPSLVRQVFWQRKLTTPSSIEAFLQPDFTTLSDPFLFKQMRTAVDRIIAAIREQQLITIYGDYDADGVTATAVLDETLRALGAKVQWYLPERLSEGYGLNMQAIEGFITQGCKLLITVDCGTSNVQEITRAKELGLDVIVVDHHHEPATMPPAVAIINPVVHGEGYPFHGFSSAGVAFTVVRALLQATENGATLDHQLMVGWEKWLLDLIAISTVADMMSLRGENRTLVRYGLLVMRKTRRPGLRALFAIMGSALERADEHTIGFMVAPRLNAAGRLKHASIALELLLTTDPLKGQQLAEQLQSINQDRQKLTELAMAEALEQVDDTIHKSAATVFEPHWSPGILGLVAGRLADRLWRPVLVMAENDGEIVGSGRSVPGMDIMAVMDAGREHFARFGGHPGACGFTLISKEQRPKFEQWFREQVAKSWQPEQATKSIAIDGRAQLGDFTPDALDILETLGPYGMEHPRPLFVIEKTKVVDAGTVGNDRQHLKLTVSDGLTTSRCIGFRHGSKLADCQPGQVIDLAVEASWNIWQGRREPQLRIIDIRQTV